MSFSITLFGPSHYWWKKPHRNWPRAWYYSPNEHSSGGIGFCLPFIHVVFMWGRH